MEVLFYFKILSEVLPGGTEKKFEKSVRIANLLAEI
jgi:hypothetical protein